MKKQPTTTEPIIKYEITKPTYNEIEQLINAKTILAYQEIIEKQTTHIKNTTLTTFHKNTIYSICDKLHRFLIPASKKEKNSLITEELNKILKQLSYVSGYNEHEFDVFKNENLNYPFNTK